MLAAPKTAVAPRQGRIDKLLSMADVCELVQLTRRTIERAVSAGRFPGPLKLSPGRRGTIRFRAWEIEDWLNGKK